MSKKARGIAPAQEKSAEHKASGPNIPGGFILIGDIVDFSKMSQEDQVAAVSHLWRFFAKPAWEKWHERAYFNCTGDGLVLTCPTGRHREFVDVAGALIKHMHSARPRVGLRIGLHLGPFSQPRLAGVNDLQAIGTGINQCARLCPLGDDGDIALSEEFVKGWYNEEQDKISRSLAPPLEEPAIEVFIKHSETMLVRFHRSKLTKGRPPPRRIQDYDRARSLLLDLLRDMEQVVEGALRNASTRIKKHQLDIRVSLFAEQFRQRRLQLRATDLRYQRSGTTVMPGDTVYPIDHGGRGPVGRAFASPQKGCQVINNLPTPAKVDAYVAAMGRQTGLEADIVRQFQRKAQTFIAIPFGLDPGKASGVICIDIMDPLTEFPIEELKSFAKELSNAYALTVAALWRIRANS
ncbi:MAG: hypothetical protein IT582_06530 [Opitutaceae bacterium]|nr:hypothetical protein [Opitutaceae bacterium]